MKLNAVLMSNNPDVFDYVYGDERIAKIGEIANLQKEVITQKNIDSMDLENIDIIFSSWGMFAPTQEQLDRMKNLKAIFYGAGATDAFCRPFLAKGVKVISAWQANAIPVAEYCVAQIILALKSFYNVSRSMTCPDSWGRTNVGPGCYGETVTLVGAGAISHNVAEMLKAYNLKVIVVPSRAEKRTISLEDAVAQSQVVSNHLPDRDDNVGVFDKKIFESMRKNAVFLNTGRGRQVNENDLVEVLKVRKDLSAVLDVTFPEPPVAGSELYTMDNIYLTPHIAGSLNDEVRRMADYVIGECESFMAGKELKYEVNESMLLTS